MAAPPPTDEVDDSDVVDEAADCVECLIRKRLRRNEVAAAMEIFDGVSASASWDGARRWCECWM